MIRALALLAGFAALVPSATAQSDLRAKVFGTVRTATGKPRAAALVVLLANASPSHPHVGTPDRIEVRTDDRGRFRAQILAGRPYTVWATAPADGTARWITAPLENVLPGEPVVLDEGPQPRAGRPLRLTGLEPWRAHGPFRCLLRSDTENVLATEIPIDADGEAELPVWPGTQAQMAVLGANDLPLRLVRVNASMTIPCELAISPPRDLHVSVRDIGTAGGIDKARLFLLWNGHRLPLGETAADGVATLQLPKPNDLTGMGDLMAMADGYTWCELQRGPSPKNKDRPLRDGVTEDLHAHLGPDTPRSGRLFWKREQPATSIALRIENTWVHYDEESSRTVGKLEHWTTTSDDGRFSLPGTWDEFGTIVSAVLSDDQLQHLPKAWHSGLHPRLPMLFAAEGKPGELGELFFDQLHPVDIQVVTNEGLPAAGAELRLYSTIESFQIRSAEFVTDRQGQLRLLLRPGNDYVLFAEQQPRWRVAQLHVGARTESTPTAITVPLLAPTVVRARLVDRNGLGIAGCRLRCAPGAQGHGRPFAARLATTSDDLEKLDAVAGVALMPVREEFRQSTWFPQGLHAVQAVATSLSDGSATFEMPFAADQFRITGRHEVGGETYEIDFAFAVEDLERGPIEIRVEVER